ncbi:MAG: hypothetical protein ACOYNN_18815, partial [Terrimicrobiaceae bacterium]
VVCIFPSGNTTWVYDVATNLWHERAAWNETEYARHRSNCQCNFNGTIVVGDYENGNIYAFDLDVYTDNGDAQRWLRSWRALPPGANNLKRTAHHGLQLICESGVGLNGYDYFDALNLLAVEDYTILLDTLGNPILDETGGEILVPIDEAGDLLITESGNGLLISQQTVQGAKPLIALRWSDDGGHTWSNEHFASMGRIGATSTRVFWRRLGMTLKLRDRVYEVTGTDPVKIAIMGAELDVTPTAA